jgi:hypothetical protein
MAKAKTKTTTSPRRSRRITDRQHREIADRVMAAVVVRDELKGRAAARRQLDRAHRPIRRIAGKLAALAIVASLTGVVIAHAMAG